MNWYLDAGVILPTVVLEDTTAIVAAFLESRAGELTVSEFAAAEVASALSRLVRMGRMTETSATDRLNDFDDWRASYTEPVYLDPHDCRLAGRYVRRFALKLRTPDALHMATCRRLDLCLVTLDTRLAAAGAGTRDCRGSSNRMTRRSTAHER